ncbi:CHAD domain-containing protein [Sphingosinicella microcystinivorans]|uniref:CHAD domain-containing protein n=1 Tax=Sphingosinicella microcystinivorans TaxID=335406 RepID=A0AAD1G1U4_SPHMI|nr:CHAD domain-containing protein [Sphingosinicella microcystinivorans]RKS92045.1 CHAD domain-containing protein [Sphingosinicella microcystinivorans]BBE35065.1 hypothetical protein SmB9_27230 [Sphingosinicella microcystinivorans]
MAYRFARGDAGIESALRRIAAEQLDGALASLEGADANLERSVHGVRTATKRIRALLRLLRAVFPGYSEANVALRTLAVRLADVREAQVMLATFDSVAGESGGKTLAAFRTELEADEAAAALRVRGAVLEDARARLLALRAAAEGWRLERDGFGALRKGLRRTCRKAVKLMGEAGGAAGDDFEAFHEWRKHIKDHGFQVRLLHDIDPALTARGEMLGRLGTLLGEQHDLCALEARLHDRREKPLRRLEKVAIERRHALEKEALKLGAILFEEPCKRRVRRWERAWAGWRDAT